jgi:hypothetical protein
VQLPCETDPVPDSGAPRSRDFRSTPLKWAFLWISSCLSQYDTPSAKDLVVSTLTIALMKRSRSAAETLPTCECHHRGPWSISLTASERGGMVSS